MAKGRPENLQLSVLGTIALHVGRGSLQARTGKSGFCTIKRNTFLDSPYPWLPFDINIALVQTRYHGER